MIIAVAIAGRPLAPDTVLAEVTILHGREQIVAPATASTATIVVETPEGPMPPWLVGDPLTLGSPAGPMFTGRITDLALTHTSRSRGQVGVFAVTAMGPVAALGVRTVGDEPWPAEPGTARAARILELAEVPYLIDGAADQVVLARDVDSRDALSLLDDLSTSTGAAVVDLPDGRVLYQPKRERARPVYPFPWADFDPALEWADFDPALEWADFATWHSLDSEFPVPIPAGAVEWEPPWTITEGTVINHMRVGYGAAPEGEEQAWTELVNPASITRHGRRYQYAATQLQDLPDAEAHALWLLATRSEPHWRLGSIVVHPERLTELERAAVLTLTCGQHVTLAGLPKPSPATVAEGIVEGWSYAMWGVDGELHERITLHLSALLESLGVPMWADHLPTFRWQDYSALHTWADLTDFSTVGA